MIDPTEIEIYLVELRTPDGELIDSYETTFPNIDQEVAS